MMSKIIGLFRDENIGIADMPSTIVANACNNRYKPGTESSVLYMDPRYAGIDFMFSCPRGDKLSIVQAQSRHAPKNVPKNIQWLFHALHMDVSGRVPPLKYNIKAVRYIDFNFSTPVHTHYMARASFISLITRAVKVGSYEACRYAHSKLQNIALVSEDMGKWQGALETALQNGYWEIAMMIMGCGVSITTRQGRYNQTFMHNGMTLLQWMIYESGYMGIIKYMYMKLQDEMRNNSQVKYLNRININTVISSRRYAPGLINFILNMDMADHAILLEPRTVCQCILDGHVGILFKLLRDHHRLRYVDIPTIHALRHVRRYKKFLKITRSMDPTWSIISRDIIPNTPNDNLLQWSSRVALTQCKCCRCEARIPPDMKYICKLSVTVIQRMTWDNTQSSVMAICEYSLFRRIVRYRRWNWLEMHHTIMGICEKGDTSRLRYIKRRYFKDATNAHHYNMAILQSFIQTAVKTNTVDMLLEVMDLVRHINALQNYAINISELITKEMIVQVVKTGDNIKLQILLACKMEDKQTEIMMAIRFGNLPLLQMLLTEHPEIRVNSAMLVYAAECEAYDILQYLVQFTGETRL